MLSATHSAGAPKVAAQLKTALELRKALFGDKLLVETDVAAASISRAPSTLRKWAMTGRGPIQPVRADGGLLWKVTDLMRIAGEVV